MNCSCPEGFLIEFGKTDDGQDTEERYRLPAGALEQHDCEYILSRNGLITAAESWANEVIGNEPPVLEGDRYHNWVREWNVEFLWEMKRLVKLHDIRKGKRS